MILLRSLPLSLSILWRFAIVAPLWTIAYLLLTVVALFGSIAFGALPFVGPLLVFALSLAISFGLMAHPTLIGIRLGLLVLDDRIDPSQGRLMRTSVVYGFIENLLGFVLSAVVYGATMFILYGTASLSRLSSPPRITDPILTLSQQMASGHVLIMWIIIALGGLLLRAALLPSLAGAAAGYDPNGHPHTPLNGIGAMFLPMLGLLLMTTAHTFVVLPVLSDVSAYLGLTNTLTNELGKIVLFFMEDETEIAYTLAQALQVAAAIAVSLWLFSLQCAGAALSFQARKAKHEARKAAAIVDDRMSPSDLRALRLNRMG